MTSLGILLTISSNSSIVSITILVALEEYASCAHAYHVTMSAGDIGIQSHDMRLFACQLSDYDSEGTQSQ